MFNLTALQARIWAYPGPAVDGVAVDVSGGNHTFSGVYPRSLYVGGAGTVKIKTIKGNDLTLTAVAGGVLPIGAQLVYQTGTSATLIVALY